MAIETLRPNAAGDEENISDVVGDGVGTHYTTVDEETPDEDTTKVRSNAATYERDLYNIPNHSVGSGVINYIKVYARCKVTIEKDQTSAKIAIKSGTGAGAPDTVSESSEIDVSVAVYTTYSNQWSTNPATSSAWTWDEIDNLQIGIAMRNANAGGTARLTNCTQVYVEVDYTPAVTEKTSSDAGSGVEAFVARLLAAFDTGYGVEAVVEVGGLLKNLFATELGRGSDSLIAKIEMPTKGGGMKLWT